MQGRTQTHIKQYNHLIRHPLHPCLIQHPLHPTHALEQHSQVRVHSQAHDLRVDGGAGFGKVRHAASRLVALYQDRGADEAREQAGHGNLQRASTVVKTCKVLPLTNHVVLCHICAYVVVSQCCGVPMLWCAYVVVCLCCGVPLLW